MITIDIIKFVNIQVAKMSPHHQTDRKIGRGSPRANHYSIRYYIKTKIKTIIKFRQ